MDKSGVYKCEAVYVISGQTFTQTSGTASLHIRGSFSLRVGCKL